MNAPEEPLYEDAAGGDDDRRSAQRAARSLAASVAKLHGTVPLPAAAQQLLRATESSDFRVAHLVKIIESDPSLTGRLMRVVNSAAKAGGRCASVTQAVTMLGVRSLRTSALAASALQWFDEAEEPMAKMVAAHGARAGTLARELASHCGLAPDEMYTAGLLHDVGKLMLLRGSDLDYCELLKNHSPPETLHIEERKRYGFDHAVLAGHVLHSWKLPRPLPQVVGWHHQPERAYRAQGEVPRMVALVRISDRLARLPDGSPKLEFERAMWRMPNELRVLGFSRDVLPSICSVLAGEAPDEASRSSMLPSIADLVALPTAVGKSEPASAGLASRSTGVPPQTTQPGPTASLAARAFGSADAPPRLLPPILALQVTGELESAGARTRAPRMPASAIVPGLACAFAAGRLSILLAPSASVFDAALFASAALALLAPAGAAWLRHRWSANVTDRARAGKDRATAP